jgi:hypothetical protein
MAAHSPLDADCSPGNELVQFVLSDVPLGVVLVVPSDPIIIGPILRLQVHWIIIGRQGHIEASSGENDIRNHVASCQAIRVLSNRWQ